MSVTVWKGHLTFGLVSIPIRLFRAARREKIRFHQLYRAEKPEQPEEDEAGAVEAYEPRLERIQQAAFPQAAFTREASEPTSHPPIPPAQIVKGFEYEKNRYVTVAREELEKIKPRTSTEMDIFEFVKFAEIDPVYLDSSYYVAPEEAGEKPYALLFETMRDSGYVALAEFAMRGRQRAVVIRPGETGILAHTLYYADEIRKSEERRADTSLVKPKEKALARTLIEAMSAGFQPEKLKDTYRESLKELIASKIAGGKIAAVATSKTAAPVVDIMEALERSLAARRKPAASEAAPGRKAAKISDKRSGRAGGRAASRSDRSA